MNGISKQFGIAVRAARAGVGIGQTELGTLSGTSRPTVNKIETGRKVRIKSIDAVVSALRDLGAAITLSETVTVTFTTMCNSNDA